MKFLFVNILVIASKLSYAAICCFSLKILKNKNSQISLNKFKSILISIKSFIYKDKNKHIRCLTIEFWTYLFIIFFKWFWIKENITL